MTASGSTSLGGTFLKIRAGSIENSWPMSRPETWFQDRNRRYLTSTALKVI
jgi:hypothetical protein